MYSTDQITSNFFLICSLTPLNPEYLDAVGTPPSVSDLFLSNFLIYVLRHLSCAALIEKSSTFSDTHQVQK